MRRWLLGIALLVVLLVGGGLLLQWKLFWPPPPVEAVEADWLPQGDSWSDAAKRDWYHHETQGTAIMPLAWFLALERPTLWPSGMLSDADYLRRFGFLDSPAPAEISHGLPVGLAVDEEFMRPDTGEKAPIVGFTCAACHTGELRYQGRAVRVEGGAAMTDLGRFRSAIGVAALLTSVMPWRFDAFALRLLGEAPKEGEARQLHEVAKLELRKKLEVWTISRLREFRQEQAAPKSRPGQNAEDGFGRLAALERISNTVFGNQLSVANLRGIEAPTAYPHIWNTHWFDWVQYNASIQQPLARNVGEALGVNAPVQLRVERAKFLSTVRLENLRELEGFLGGANPEAGLQSPKWPESFPTIDPERARRGAELYAERCEKCHSRWEEDSPRWKDSVDLAGEPLRLYSVHTEPVGRIGTDPTLAVGFADGEVMGLAEAPISAVAALTQGIDGVQEAWFAAHQTPPDEQAEMRQRPNGIRATVSHGRIGEQPSYKARPLNGVWATPPFLHNGAVRTLYDLLSPVPERSRKFRLGSREFDPVRIGYESAGEFELDTALPGNCNAGHEFTDAAPLGCSTDAEMLESNGTRLTPEQRMHLIEYLKTL